MITFSENPSESIFVVEHRTTSQTLLCLAWTPTLVSIRFTTEERSK